VERTQRLWLAASAGLVTAVAGVDIATGDDLILVALLVLGPLLASIRLSTRPTAGVAAYALALAVVIGVATDTLAEADHLFRMAVVAVGGGLAAIGAALRERAEAARAEARASRDELAVILQGLADGVTVQDRSGRLLYANDAAARAMGLQSGEEAVSEGGAQALARFEIYDEAGNPFDPDRLPGRLALGGEEPPPTTIRFRTRESNDERWAVVKARPVRDERGEVTMAINIMEDVTEQKRAEREQTFLAEAGRLLTGSLDYEQTLQTVAELAVPEIADWCAVDVFEEGREIRHVGLAAVDPDKLRLAKELRTRYPTDPDAPTGVPEVLRTGTSQLYEEIPDEMLEQGAQDEEHLRLIRSVGLRSAMIAPLVARARTLGAITFVTSESSRRFDANDLALAEEIGRRAGVAVDNARLFGERSHIARVLQESLLPQGLPEMPEADLVARFLPAGGGTEVGGDFYDLFKLPSAGWGLVIGDVCGKGADAAALTALARYTLRTAAMQAASPVSALESLNRAILERAGDRRFCTAAFAQLEPVAGGLRATIACGGHPLPLILRTDGTVTEAGGRGRLLGVDPDAQLKDEVVDLAAGDSLVLYTDGLTDAHAPVRVLLEEDIERLLAGCAGDDASEIAECLEHAALGDNGRTARDDIALMVLRARTSAA